jgi:hypothetical protein
MDEKWCEPGLYEWCIKRLSPSPPTLKVGLANSLSGLNPKELQQQVWVARTSSKVALQNAFALRNSSTLW